MAQNRNPENLEISKDDFLASGWKQILERARCENYVAMYQAFLTAAQRSIEQGNAKCGKVFSLLAEACSMRLCPSSMNEPFESFAVFGSRRTAIPDDFSDADTQFFSSIIDAVDNDRLRARLCELVWLRSKPRCTECLLKAIDAYRRIPLEAKTWLREEQDCWSRAVHLAQWLKTNAGDRLAQIEAAILGALVTVTHADASFGLRLACLLKSHDLGRGHLAEVAGKLESLARALDQEGYLIAAGEHFSAASDWYKAIPDANKAAEMTAAVAEELVKEGVARTTSEHPSYMAAASFYEDAIQAYRSIPRAERAAHQVDERIEELRLLLKEAGANSLDEMHEVQSPSIDLRDAVEQARRAVAGKPVEEALVAFANLARGANEQELRTRAVERIQRFPLTGFWSATVISRDGRVVAKRPALSSAGAVTESDEQAIRAEMLQEYCLGVGLVVQGEVLPALEVLRLEHRLRLDDFVCMARNAPIVPGNRAELVGKALFSGYECDFAVALHLLIPQIEHLVRVRLQQAGAKTTNLDKNGIETENGLSTLMALPEADRVFGKDFAFELRSLFCDAYGPNLRNELAHGLLDDADCRSQFAVYAWWLMLRLTIHSLYLRRRSKVAKPGCE